MVASPEPRRKTRSARRGYVRAPLRVSLVTFELRYVLELRFRAASRGNWHVEFVQAPSVLRPATEHVALLLPRPLQDVSDALIERQPVRRGRVRAAHETVRRFGRAVGDELLLRVERARLARAHRAELLLRVRRF